MSRTIPVSFKNTTKDNFLFEEVKKKGDQSNFVKECIDFFLKYKDKELKVIEVPKPVEVKKESIDPKAKAALNQFFIGDDD